MEKPIYVYGVIGQDFDAEYLRLILDEASGNLEVRINSPGGDVFSGQAIYTLLLDYKKRTGNNISVYVDALAASIASVIACAGDEIVMASNALMMVHNPWTPQTGGDATTLRETADVLDKVAETIMTVYESCTGLDRETIAALMDEETWLSASEAVGLGFATSISEPSEVVHACVKSFGYVNAPQWLDFDKPEMPSNGEVAGNARRNRAAVRLAISRCCNKK